MSLDESVAHVMVLHAALSATGKACVTRARIWRRIHMREYNTGRQYRAGGGGLITKQTWGVAGVKMASPPVANPAAGDAPVHGAVTV